MIVFQTIRWRNILSTGNAWNEVKLDQYATTLVVGQNGHGKSTMLDALTFALFGKPFRKINKPNLINSINQKECLVELEFRIGGRQYFIRRGMNPNVFVIYVDGQEQNQDAISRDYQKYLETNILKFSYRAFTQIVILGSKSFVPFMKLQSHDRRAIIENLLDIQIFSLMNKVAKEDLVKARQDLDDNKRSIDNTKEQIALQQKYVEDAKKNSQARAAEIQEDIEEHQRQLQKIDLEIVKAKQDIEALSIKTADHDKISAGITQLSNYGSKIQQNLSKARKEHDFYRDNDNCPTCHQDLESTFKHQVMDQRQVTITQYAAALKKLEQEKSKRLVEWKDIQNLMMRINELQNEISSLAISKKHINDYISRRTNEIDELSNKKVLSDDMMEVSQDLVNKFQAYNDARKGLVENRAYYEIAVNLLKDGGIKAQIIKQYLPVINKMVNKYLAAMDFFVNFELDEEFNETIKSRHRDAFTYDSFSEGEKQKIDIALLFAWRAVAKLKNSMNTNLLILDEIFDSSLDGTGADLVLGILASMPEHSNVFVISHRELLHDKFSNTIRFEKRNSFSEIVDHEE